MPTIPKPSRRGYLPPQSERVIQGRRLSPNSDFYHSTRWRNVREQQLNLMPLCEQCTLRGLVVAATVVDHITPINEGGESLDLHNLQSLCARCHNKKSGSEAHKKR